MNPRKNDPPISRGKFFSSLGKQCLGLLIQLGDSLSEGESAQVPPRVEDHRASWRRRPALIRPPGACLSPDFEKKCAGCGGCEKACPHKAILMVDGVKPVPCLRLEVNPCRWCHDFPCIQACPSGALRLKGEGGEPVAIARVTCRAELCLNGLGSPCRLCVEKCPLPSKGVTLNGKKPLIEAHCVGCGVCAHYCLAPENPFIIVPIAIPIPLQIDAERATREDRDDFPI